MNKELLITLSVLSGLAFSSCSISSKDKQALIDTIPLAEKQSALLNYDKELLKNLETLKANNDKNYLQNAHYQTKSALVYQRNKKDALYYLLDSHADLREKESYTSRRLPMGGLSILPGGIPVIDSSSIVVRDYRQEFPCELKTKITAQSVSNKAQQAQPRVKVRGE